MPVHHSKNKYYFVYLIFKFLDTKVEDKIFCTCPDFSLLLISSWIELWFVKVVTKYLNNSTLSKELLSICDFILHSDLETWPCTVHTYISSHFLSSLHTNHYQSYCVFLYSMYTSSQHIVISINQQLMCTISFQAIPVYLNPPNGIL